MKQDIHFYKRACEDTSADGLWTNMLEYFVSEYSRIARLILGAENLDPQLAYSIRLYSYGAVWMPREWILQDTGMPAEEAIRMMFASMPDRLRETYFRDHAHEH